MNHSAIRMVLLAAAVSGVWAQSQTPLKFDVSTVKPSGGDDHRIFLGSMPGGRFQASGVTLKLLMSQAYNIRDFQIVGGPAWIGTERFDVTEGPAEILVLDRVEKPTEN